jgi:hypothetical protein
MINPWFQFEFKAIDRNYQHLLDLSMFGHDWMLMDDQLLNNPIGKVSYVECLQRHSVRRREQ